MATAIEIVAIVLGGICALGVIFHWHPFIFYWFPFLRQWAVNAGFMLRSTYVVPWEILVGRFEMMHSALERLAEATADPPPEGEPQGEPAAGGPPRTLLGCLQGLLTEIRNGLLIRPSEGDRQARENQSARDERLIGAVSSLEKALGSFQESKDSTVKSLDERLINALGSFEKTVRSNQEFRESIVKQLADVVEAQRRIEDGQERTLEVQRELLEAVAEIHREQSPIRLAEPDSVSVEGDGSSGERPASERGEDVGSHDEDLAPEMILEAEAEEPRQVLFDPQELLFNPWDE